MAYSKAGRYKIKACLTMGKAPKNGEPPHVELANMADAVAAGWAFYDRWGATHAESLVTPEQAVRFRASGLPCPYLLPELRDEIRKAWRGDEHSLEYIKRSAGRYMKFAWEFKGKDIDLVPEDLWSTMCVLFLRDKAAHRLAICENPECLSPHFIRKRKTQKFCEAGDCTAYGQKLRSSKWWKANGNEWREKKSSRRAK